MKQRVNLITLGVADLGRASRVENAPGWGGVTLALFWGGYSGIFIDPDGHPWEVAHNPHWRVTEDGGIRLS